MDVSRWFERAPPWRRPSLVVDWAASSSEDAVRAALARAIEERPAQAVSDALPASLPARLREALCASVGVTPGRRGAEVSRAERHALVQAVKRTTLDVSGTRGFDHAEVTAGGVALPEVDPGTMASRLVPGLFVVGEILDVDGPIGGFNFQAAFSTAELAGRAV
jgi:predicted Rossmann fold flavoprotein